ncbi:MAG: hypothetical protein K6A69_02915 [Lachnospiraceae bacterium]|nr:hypothetical protein [Lachnospiraceae bacterium]
MTTTSGTIVYCEKGQLITKITDWMFEHLGRVTVGRELGGEDVEIIAYSDNKEDSAFLHKMARDGENICLVSPGKEEVNAID